jgi:hypothetical protein
MLTRRQRRKPATRDDMEPSAFECCIGAALSVPFLATRPVGNRPQRRERKAKKSNFPRSRCAKAGTLSEVRVVENRFSEC